MTTRPPAGPAVNVESEATYENGVLKPNQPLPLSDKQRVRITVHAPEANGEAVRLRQQLANDLVRRVDELLPLVGDIALATNLQLLKRDLSRCHDALKDHPEEGNFLSIVTLVESALAQLKWKQYTPAQLEAIRQAFDIGTRQVQVRFEDYDWARRLFIARHVAPPRASTWRR